MNRKAKSLMVLKGVSNQDIARKYNVSETWVSLVLHGKGESRRIKKAIARSVRVRIEDLWPADATLRRQGFGGREAMAGKPDEKNNKRKAA